MDRIDEYAEIVGVDIRGDAVPEIEDVARPGTIARERIGDALAYDVRALTQGRRVEVALQRDLVTDVGARRFQVRRPVDAKRVAAGTRSASSGPAPFVNRMTGTV